MVATTSAGTDASGRTDMAMPACSLLTCLTETLPSATPFTKIGEFGSTVTIFVIGDVVFT